MRIMTTGWGAALLAAAICGPLAANAAPTTTTTTTDHAVPVAEQGTDDLVPLVKVEISVRGRVLKTKPTRLDWGEPAEIRLKRGDEVHDVTVEVTRKGQKANALRVVMSYEIDGEQVIDAYSYDTKTKKREVLRTDGAALALTVLQKSIEEGPSSREDKLEPPVDTNDPLAGL